MIGSFKVGNIKVKVGDKLFVTGDEAERVITHIAGSGDKTTVYCKGTPPFPALQAPFIINGRQPKPIPPELTALNAIEEFAEVVDTSDRNRLSRSFSLLGARDAIFFKRLDQFCGELWKKNPIKPSGLALKKNLKPIKRELHLDISDIHVRAMLDPRELPVAYQSIEEARRLARVALEVAEFKPQYRDHTALNVNILGDVIQGVLDHDPRDGAPLAEQCGAAIHLLTQMVVFFSQNFPKVSVRCTPGNHGRNPGRHKARAMHQKWDGFETIIYSAIKNGVAHLPNVKVEIPYTPFFIYNSLGHHILGTHGDTFITVGNPGNSIDVKNVSKRINEINASYDERKKIEIVTAGHVHVGSRTRLNNGVVLITNGALIPPDGFMVNGLGKLDMTCLQVLWESTEKYVAGDYRELTVGVDADKDSSLDKVISPFEAF
jgi:hypothetical protein